MLLALSQLADLSITNSSPLITEITPITCRKIGATCRQD
jgi:hypothetical protein